MKIQLFKYLFVVLMAGFIQCCTTKVPSAGDKLYRDSDYIFQGKITKSQDSNFPEVNKSDNTFIVKVNKVVLASEGHENFEGQDITVVIDREKAGKMKEGDAHLFYTKTWLFGKTLAVIANELVPFPADLDEVKKDIAQFQEKKDKESLKQRLDKAELVLAGRVIETRVVEDQKTTKESEHSPDWRMAVLEIKEIMKGEQSAAVIQFYFSGSDDIQWYQSPKFQKEDQGIFLLKRMEGYPGLQEAFLLIDQRDFLNESDMEMVKDVLQNK